MKTRGKIYQIFVSTGHYRFVHGALQTWRTIETFGPYNDKEQAEKQLRKCGWKKGRKVWRATDNHYRYMEAEIQLIDWQPKNLLPQNCKSPS